MAVTVCSATDLNNRAVCSSRDESELWSLAFMYLHPCHRTVASD